MSQDEDGSLITEWLTAREMCRAYDDDDDFGFWRVFEQEGELVGTLGEWQRLVGAVWADCVPLFRDAAAVATSLPCPRRGSFGCARRVSESERGYVASCGAEDARCGEEVMTKDDVRLTKFDLDGFRLRQRKAWSVTGDPGTPSRTSQIGRYNLREGVAPRVFLCLEPPTAVSQSLTGLVAQSQEAAIVLVPTAKHLDAATDDLLARHGWELVALDGCQSIEANARIKPTRAPEEVLARFRARLAGPMGSSDAGHHAFAIGRLFDPERVICEGISSTAYNRLVANDVDLLMDFTTGKLASPSGKGTGPAAKIKSRNFGGGLRKLAQADQPLRLSELPSPFGANDNRAQTYMSQLRAPFKKLTDLDWIVSRGSRGDLVYLWRPPPGWSYLLVFGVTPDL